MRKPRIEIEIACTHDGCAVTEFRDVTNKSLADVSDLVSDFLCAAHRVVTPADLDVLEKDGLQ